MARLFDRIIDYRNIWEKDRINNELGGFFCFYEKIFHFQCVFASPFPDRFLFWFSADRSHLGQAKHKGYSPPESRKSNSKAPKVQSNTTSELSRGHLSKR